MEALQLFFHRFVDTYMVRRPRGRCCSQKLLICLTWSYNEEADIKSFFPTQMLMIMVRKIWREHDMMFTYHLTSLIRFHLYFCYCPFLMNLEV